MKIDRRLRTFAALAAFVALAATAVSCHKSEAASEPPGPQPPPGQVWLTPQQVKDAKIEVQTIAEQDVDDTILTSGRVALDDMRSAHVFTPVTGRVVKIIAGLGQRVKKGDPLAVIESPDIGNAVSDVHKAEADLIAAEHDFKRKKDLFEQKAGSAADQEASEDNWRKAKAEVERARQKAYLLRAGNVDTVTQTYTLPSPIDGEVLAMNINPGMEVQGQYTGGATQELFTIGEIDKVWVIGDLYEMDLARVQVGAPAAVTTVAYKDKVFNGQVDWVSGMLDPSTRTAKVRSHVRQPRPAAAARDVRDRPDLGGAEEGARHPAQRAPAPRRVQGRLRPGRGRRRLRQVRARCPWTSTRARRASGSRSSTGSKPGRRSSSSGAILLSQKL